ncbi:MAG: hypothetical protein QXO75_08475 [Nitrososphaerota archaeon]
MFKIASYYKLDYLNHIAQRKHALADIIRYIGKESNNIDESMILGLDDNSYIEYENLEEFYNWVLKLKHKDIRNKGTSKKIGEYKASLTLFFKEISPVLFDFFTLKIDHPGR